MYLYLFLTLQRLVFPLGLFVFDSSQFSHDLTLTLFTYKVNLV